jgi:hypothetical protein
MRVKRARATFGKKNETLLVLCELAAQVPFREGAHRVFMHDIILDIQKSRAARWLFLWRCPGCQSMAMLKRGVSPMQQ